MKLSDFDSLGKHEGVTAWVIALAMPFAALALLMFARWITGL